jgi:phenylpropionate dioxygenase-like ring-hydroxylating dioxygenase large terminal subunit
MRDDFCKADYGLRSLLVEEWLGFVFVNLDAQATSLNKDLAELTAYVADYQIARMQTVRRQTFTWKCNWKIALENAMEPLHLPTTHPTTLAPLMSLSAVKMRRPGKKFHWYDIRTTEDDEVLPPLPSNFIPNTSGADWPRRFTVGGGIFPCLNFFFSYDNLWFISCQPISPSEVRLEHGVAAAYDLTGKEAEPDSPVRQILDLDDAFLPEDIDRVEGVQRGAASGFAVQSELSPYEETTHGLSQYLVSMRICPKPDKNFLSAAE